MQLTNTKLNLQYNSNHTFIRFLKVIETNVVEPHKIASKIKLNSLKPRHLRIFQLMKGLTQVCVFMYFLFISLGILDLGDLGQSNIELVALFLSFYFQIMVANLIMIRYSIGDL